MRSTPSMTALEAHQRVFLGPSLGCPSPTKTGACASHQIMQHYYRREPNTCWSRPDTAISRSPDSDINLEKWESIRLCICIRQNIEYGWGLSAPDLLVCKRIITYRQLLQVCDNFVGNLWLQKLRFNVG